MTSESDGTHDQNDKLQKAMANASKEPIDKPTPLIDQVIAALRQSGTDVPAITMHTMHLAKVMELEGTRVADRIYQIDQQLAELLAERQNAIRAYETATGVKLG